MAAMGRDRMTGPGAAMTGGSSADGDARKDAAAARLWSPWRVVVGFGVISLAADMVYEGARSVYGPLLAVTPALGGAGLVVASVLILTERADKALRSPAKSALLADAAGEVGMGRGLGVHKALDQIGAFAGPLLVAGLIAASGGDLRLGLTALAVPGAVTMALLVLTRRRAPQPAPTPTVGAPAGSGLSGRLASHDGSARRPARSRPPSCSSPPRTRCAPPGCSPVRPTTGWRTRPAHFALPGGRLPGLAFGRTLSTVVPGALLSGAAVGLQDSTVKAMVADLVPRDRRATAYGVFAAVQGAGALAGGVAAGALYQRSLGALPDATGDLDAVHKRPYVRRWVLTVWRGAAC